VGFLESDVGYDYGFDGCEVIVSSSKNALLVGAFFMAFLL
jgi:hypothetical protein